MATTPAESSDKEEWPGLPAGETKLMRLLKTVFHVHTDYSHDCDSPPEAVVAEARARGVQCLTVTDHDTIDGARAAAACAGPDLQIVVGEEISTQEGHLIGLFLHECVEPGLPARRTADLIHRQGGLVVVPHPFNRLFDCSLRDNVYGMIDLADAVEVCNAQNFLSGPNRRSRGLAERFRLPMLAGVDSHHPGSLDSCYQWMPPFRGSREFLLSLREAQLVEGRHPAGYFLKTAWYTLWDRSGLAVPESYGRNSPYRIREREPAGQNA